MAPSDCGTSRQTSPRRFSVKFTPDGEIVMTPKARPAPSGWPPHPLDVNIRQLPREILYFQAGARTVKTYVTDCPDGYGVVVWTDTMLPFNAPDVASAEATIIRSYSM